MTLTPKELEIKERCEKATPGPWWHYYNKLRDQFATMVNEVQAKGKAIVKWPGFDGLDQSPAKVKANALFIAHARTDIPELLSTISTLREENRRLKDALTPSAQTKAAYMGEFQFQCGELTPNVPWTTIKEIMSAIFTYAGSGRVEPGFNQEGVSPGAKQL